MLDNCLLLLDGSCSLQERTTVHDQLHLSRRESRDELQSPHAGRLQVTCAAALITVPVLSLVKHLCLLPSVLRKLLTTAAGTIEQVLPQMELRTV
jgi:hypothetical protein